MSSTTDRGSGLIYLSFACSGAASLICQIVWFKQIQLIVGSSVIAVSIVVACFFSGLSLGSWAVGALSDRFQRPLLLYGGLELFLALLSFGITTVLGRWDQWSGFLAPYMGLSFAEAAPVTIGISAALLLPPTILMGASLPILARHLVQRNDQLAARIGALYAVNTLGAAIGCLAAGYILIAHLGVQNSALCAAALYMCCGLTALFVQALVSRQPGGSSQPRPALASNESSPETLLNPGRLICVLFFSGFTAIAYEVLWFRLLTFFAGRTVYALSAMLFTYLIGLVVGALICSRLLSRRHDRLLRYFAQAQLLVAAAGMVSMAMLSEGLRFLRAIDATLIALGMPTDVLGVFSRSDAAGFVLSFAVLFIPTAIIGVTFPLASEIGVRNLSRLGGRLGSLYAVNTLGGVFGSLVAAFVFLPLFGSQQSFIILAAISLLLFFLVASSNTQLRARLRRTGILGAATVAAMALILPANVLLSELTAFAGAKVLSFHEGPEATTIVVEYDSPVTGRYQQLIVNGISYANNLIQHRRYMAFLGHVPVLLHPNPRSAVVIAVGTGTTAGSLTLHPTLEKIWAVDISPEVFRAASHFRPLNHDFTSQPAVQTVVADGRHFLQVTDQTFDVLTFEPPPPVEAGVVNLYSREFYQLARRRMNRESILAQWIPLTMGREGLVEMLIKTMAEVFPHVSLWMPNGVEGVVLASDSPLKIDREHLLAQFARPELSADLAGYGFGSIEELLATFVTADGELRSFVERYPVVTDDRPRIEQFNLYPPKLFSYEALRPFSQPVERFFSEPALNGQPYDRAPELAAAKRLTEILWTQYTDQAALERANAMAPGNRYVEYLIGQLEAYGP